MSDTDYVTTEFFEDDEENMFASLQEEEPPPVSSEKVTDTPTEAKPQRVKSYPRHSTSDFFTLVYGSVGGVLTSTGADIPVGRVLQFQAPIAGPKLEEFVKYTWLDKLLQPLVRSQEAVEGVGSLLALPLMVGLIERNPNVMSLPIVEQILRRTVESTLTDLVPQMKKQMRDRQKTAKAFSELHELGDELGWDKEDMADPIAAVIRTFFAPPPEGDTSNAETG